MICRAPFPVGLTAASATTSETRKVGSSFDVSLPPAVGGELQRLRCCLALFASGRRCGAGPQRRRRRSQRPRGCCRPTSARRLWTTSEAARPCLQATPGLACRSRSQPDLESRRDCFPIEISPRLVIASATSTAYALVVGDFDLERSEDRGERVTEGQRWVGLVDLDEPCRCRPRPSISGAQWSQSLRPRRKDGRPRR